MHDHDSHRLFSNKINYPPFSAHLILSDLMTDNIALLELIEGHIERQIFVMTVADPETSERGGVKKHEI